MTFTEAALVVLENEGRPMHSREIASMAVEQGILSHVGKTPVQTMSARLSAAVAKGRGNSPFVRIRPGVFALAAWNGNPPGKKPEPKPAPAPKPEIPSKPAPALKPKKVEKKAELKGEPADTEQTKKKSRRRRKKRSDEVETATKPVSTPPAPAKPPAKQSAKPARKDVRIEDDKNERADESIIDRIESLIRKSTRPVPVETLVKNLGRSDKNATTLLHALLIADGLSRESMGLRPRFVEHRSGYSLAEREISSEILGLEKQITDAKERLTKLAEKQIQRKIRNISMISFVRVMIVYLQRLGFEEMVPVSRNERDEFHLSMQDRRHGGRFRTAVVLRRDPVDKPLQDRPVVDLRGALHHYDSTSGMIVTTGVIGDRARAEATVPNLPPVALVDGDMLSSEMVRLGVGVRTRTIDLPVFDDALFSVFEA